MPLTQTGPRKSHHHHQQHDHCTPHHIRAIQPRGLDDRKERNRHDRTIKPLTRARRRRLTRRLSRHDEPGRKHRHPIRHHRELKAKARNGRRSAGGIGIVGAVVAIVALRLAEARAGRATARATERFPRGARALMPALVGLHASADGCGGRSVDEEMALVRAAGKEVPFDETPAPISMSGSSTTRPLSMGLPPVPPNSAVNIHFRSASVRASMGMILMPVW